MPQGIDIKVDVGGRWYFHMISGGRVRIGEGGFG